MAAAHGKAGNLRAAGKEAHAQVIEHRAVTGKVGVGNRKALADKLKAARKAGGAAVDHPGQPEVEASRKTGHEDIPGKPDLREAVARHRLNKGPRSARLDNLANQAQAHHEMIALDQGAGSKAYQSAIKRAIRIKRAADAARPELTPAQAAMVRKGNDERFDEAMATTPKRAIKLRPTTPLHRSAREAIGSALESRAAAEEANRTPGLDPEKKGRYFAVAERRYKEAQGPLKALRKEQGRPPARASAPPAATPRATPSEQSPGHASRDVPDEPTSEGLMAKGYREIGPNAGKEARPAPVTAKRPMRDIVNERAEKLHQDNQAAAKGASSVVLGNGDTTGFNKLIVHPSAHSKGKWQLSRISASNGEPMGHSTHETMEDAIASASGKSVGGVPPIGDGSFKVIDKKVPKAAPQATAQVARPAPASPAVHLPTFAANVHSSAASIPRARRFGGDKAFIHDVHGAYQAKHGPISREQFNQHLLDANRAGHLELSRADMVEAMKPADVEASDTRHMGATYNFVRVKGGEARAPAAPAPAPAPAPAKIDWKAMIRDAEAAQRRRDADVLKAARAAGALPRGKGAVLAAAAKLPPRDYGDIIRADERAHLPMERNWAGDYTPESLRRLRRKRRELLTEKLRDAAGRPRG